MKKEIFKKIEIPEGIEAKVEEGIFSVRGKEGENKRKFDAGGLDFKIDGREIVVGNKKATKKEKKRINSIAAHIRNMVKGVDKKFEYRLKICFSHFPFTVEIKGDEAIIKNFLGEKIPRKINLPQKIEVKVDRQEIIVNSIDKELAGEAAANLERVTKVRARDRRIFQDGIFIISKPGDKA